ncbi:MAG: hypothetical protein ACYDG2_06440 [Ruminiclostridium sp.]
MGNSENVIQGFYTFLVDALFTLVYILFKFIWTPIILHVIFNNTSTFADKLLSKQILDGFGFAIVIVSFLIFGVIGYYLIKNREKDITLGEEV